MTEERNADRCQCAGIKGSMSVEALPFCLRPLDFQFASARPEFSPVGSEVIRQSKPV